MPTATRTTGTTRAAGDETRVSPAEVINRGLLAGTGRYTRLEVTEQAGIPLDHARRLWRAVGFPETRDDQRVFTSADVAALAGAAGLLTAGTLDTDGLVELARPFGHQLSRLAAAQTSFLSDVLGARIAAGHLAEDPASAEQMAAQAVLITEELLPVLERTTVYVWRRHLAAEAGRALLPTATRRQRRIHSCRPRPAPRPRVPATAHLPAAPNPAPGAYRPHPMTGAAGAALERMRRGQETTWATPQRTSCA
jgi:hypothetical protein